MQVQKGDTVRIESNKVGTAPRVGTVERVIQDDPVKLEVRWEDGHASIIEPSGGNLQVVGG